MAKRKFFILCAGILVLHLCLVIFYGMRKEGFYLDEYYTYFTSAGIPGPYPYDEPLQEIRGYELQRQFLVTDEHRFDFGTVTDLQAKDVHPPLYYLTLNAMMSFFPNQFYKWFGIVLNALYSLVSCCAVIFFILRLDTLGGRYRYILAAIAGLAYALSPAMISNVMFTRMYAMSTMWTVLYANVFVELMNNPEMSRRRFSILTFLGAVVCYCSFLTHYFCLFMAFFLTLGYCIYTLFRRRGIVRMLLYGVSMTVAILLGVLTYPASISQIFGGYRGEGAISSLFGFGLWESVRLFGPVVDKYFFAGLSGCVLAGLVVSLAVSVIIMVRRGKCAGNIVPVIIAMGSCVLTFYLLTRTSLYAGEISSRFFYPVGALFIPLAAYCICKPWFVIGLRDGAHPAISESGRRGIYGMALRCLCVAAVALTLFPAILGLVRNNVLFLYSGKRNNLQYAQENSRHPAVVLYNGDARYRAWFIANELWLYENVVYIDGTQESFQESDLLKNAEKVVVYISGPEDWMARLVDQYQNLDSYTPVEDYPFENDFFAIYKLE